MSSPKANASSARAQASASTVPTTMYGRMWSIIWASRPDPLNEPTAQNLNWSNVWISSTRIVDVIDPSMAATAAPASASFTGVAPPRPAEPSA